jgi:aquaporin Z
MGETFKRHWPEYLMEAAGLGLFMVSACLVTILLEHPSSPIRNALPDPVTRRALIGLAMGLTAVSIIYSPWGKQSGAHLNPAVTLAFLRLGKIQPADALGYVAAQFLGGVTGVLLVALPLMSYLADPSVNYAVTVPGIDGPGAAFAGEAMIAFGLMFVVLTVSNRPRVARFTGLFAGVLVATYITLEAPLSGMSMNPARTMASAVPSRIWTSLWIYFTAPVIGMLAAAQLFLWFRTTRVIACPKLHHDNPFRCIFCNKPAL